jgi:serine protease Do
MNTLRCLVASLAFGAVMLAPVDALAQQSQASPDDLAFARRLSNVFKSVAGKAEPAVVHITSLNRVRMRRGFFDQIGQEQIVPNGLGSGLIVSADGYILTNHHVVKQADQLRVKLATGEEVDAKLVGTDELTDLAVLKIEREGLPYLEFGDSEVLDVGEWVVAIGSPFGFSSTVTAGIVSAKSRSINPKEGAPAYQDFIQTDAAINPGNSGGPLLDLNGKVIGVNSAIATRTGGYEGIGFAIPATIAKPVMENLITNKRVIRGWLGVSLQDATGEQLAGKAQQGAVVTQVAEDSPAQAAGIEVGDVIFGFQGKALNELRMRNAIALSSPGSEAKIDLLREGRAKSVKATIGDLGKALGNEYLPTIGASVRPLDARTSRAYARDLGVEKMQPLSIVEIDPAGIGAEAGLRAGDVIVGVEGEAVVAIEEFTRNVSELDAGKRLRLNVLRQGRMRNIEIGG